ncbi:MAG: Uncharacterized protein Athens071426_164 [Parcubacteria group bacterium Athens0714_26]|nr:MAG: Uncharacterized protein Athens101426_270 [Parcubacteria group bacterium Athens1014_26]TSD03620.1 MAG: Uncharacterized protein Athens071426_164 [Parcubacteria group bacterium Athens0714_26]
MDKKIKTKFVFHNSGQVMIEAMVAITIAIVALLGIFSLLSSSLGVNKTTADQYVAANLASEGIELVKNFIDSNVVNSRAFNDGPCLTEGQHAVDYNDINNNFSSCSTQILAAFLDFDSGTGIYSYEGGNPSRYQRIVDVSWLDGGNQIKVKSSVFWTTIGNNQSKIELEDMFFNWRR